MNYWKEIKSKNWIDWLKIVVAIDIAGVGVGLVLGFEMHVFANILGFITRIIFGVLYVFVAVLIFKRVFPQKLADDENAEAARMDDEIKETAGAVKKTVKKVVEKANELTDKAHEKIDGVIDKGEAFLGKRHEELKEEVKKLTNE
ncbi:hypothetical protein KC929_00910 [Patescibacteria group bacterium]|nr:hypothetical protein [Patescibacteria group bacterium]